MILPSADINENWEIKEISGVRVVRLKSPPLKDLNYVRRTINEFLMPFFMLHNLKKSPIAKEKWEGIVWYSPSIFHGPLVNSIKKVSGCKGYLIIRDIFPDWALDMGLIGRGIPFYFFSLIARYQYHVADIIGIQSKGNYLYFEKWKHKPSRKLEVLNNWLNKPENNKCSIRINQTSLAERRIFVYAGNVGVAQGIDILLDLAIKLYSCRDIGFLFVGRGTETHRVRKFIKTMELNNVLCFEEIDPDEIQDLYSQCIAGIVSLDPRHKSHNIPGKFISYMQCGLPVLANVNKGNDLVSLILDENVGQVSDSNSIDDLLKNLYKLLDQVDNDNLLPQRCRDLFERKFSSEIAINQIIKALTN